MTGNARDFRPDAEPAEFAELPVTLAVGEVVQLTVGGHRIVAVGTALLGFAAVLSAGDWHSLCRYKLDRFGPRRPSVRQGLPVASTRRPVITNAATGHVVRYRNGNMFDLRLSNLAVVPRSLVTWAKRPVSHEVGDVTLRDGRMRSRRKPTVPSAANDLRRQWHRRTSHRLWRPKPFQNKHFSQHQLASGPLANWPVVSVRTRLVTTRADNHDQPPQKDNK